MALKLVIGARAREPFTSVVKSPTPSIVTPQTSSASAFTLSLGSRPAPAAGSGSSSAKQGTEERSLHSALARELAERLLN